MKTDVTTYGALLQSQNKAKALKMKTPGVSNTDPKAIDPKVMEKAKSTSPDYKLDIQGQAPIPSAPTPDAPDLSTGQSRPSKIEKKEPPKKPEIKKPSEIKLDDVKEGSLNKPAIIFIKGLDIFSSPSKSERGYSGVGKIAEAIEGSRIYGWDQHDEIIKEISKIRRDQPVVLVGHSLGGDTALEVAEELDSLENQFRKVDLLITIDSVGANNDIVPQNVKNHLNVFGEKDFFLNDGPHVARRHELTKVKNILSSLDHTELDNDKEIQFEIVSLIKETIGKSV